MKKEIIKQVSFSVEKETVQVGRHLFLFLLADLFKIFASIKLTGSIGASVHPTVMVTQPGTMTVAGAGAGASCSSSATASAGATWERASNQSSSPSHSQMSRNSSRKSNNSILVSNGKLECN